MTRSIPLALLLLPAVGCGSTYRTELVGQARLAAEPPAGTPLHAELVVPPETADAYLLSYDVRLPCAMELAYEIRCPDGTRSGVLGETFEAYRTRRLAELEEQRRRQAQMVGSLVGAVVPGVQAQAAATSPGASASAQATVRPGEVATEAALQSMPAAALPPGDVGARTLHEELELDGSAFGACTFSLASNVPGQDISGATVDLALRRRIDVEAERLAIEAVEFERSAAAGRELRASLAVELEGRGATRRSAAERRQAGVDLRASLAAGLAAAGADPGLRDRERAAAEAERARVARQRAEEERVALEARLGVEAEARVRVEVEARARARVDAELLAIALGVRAGLRASLIGLGADPDLRRREAEERARRDREREASLEIEWREREAALEIERRERAAAAEVAERERMLAEWGATQRRLEVEARGRADHRAGLDLRADLRASLHAAGAVDRPPRPAARYEEPSARPFEGAVWISGEWVWSGAAWVWREGRYEASAAAAGLGVLGIGVEGGVSIEVRPVTVHVEAERR